jgi:hypothetical protein
VCNIRPDTNFDELIRKIYGNVSSIEKYEEEENAQLNKQNIMNNQYYDAESVKRRILQQNEQRVSQYWRIYLACLMHTLIVLLNSNSIFICEQLCRKRSQARQLWGMSRIQSPKRLHFVRRRMAVLPEWRLSYDDIRKKWRWIG